LDAVEPAFAAHVEAGYEAQFDEAPEDGAAKVYSTVREPFVHLAFLKALRKRRQVFADCVLSCKRKFLLSHKTDRSQLMLNVVQTAFSDVEQNRPVFMIMDCYVNGKLGCYTRQTRRLNLQIWKKSL
jgi:hypothetical protein